MSTEQSSSQASHNLPQVSTHVTGHDAETGKAVIQSSREGFWQSYDNDKMTFNVVYTTSEFPPQMNDDKDIAQHDALMASGKLGLVNPGGVVCRMVDFSPAYECIMHRTQSLDFGLVLEGEIEMVLDSGETKLMKRGDVAVQRGTMHAWRNPSSTQWARMYFILQNSQKLTLGGNELGEDLGRGAEGLGPSQTE